MRRLLLLCLLSLTWFGCAPARPTKVIFFGDSVTDIGGRPGGFIPRLSDALSRKLSVELLAAGEAGNKITDLNARLARDVLPQKPDVVVIYVGLNDVWHKILPGLQGTPPEQFESIYESILKQLEERKIRFVLCTPSLLGECKANRQDTDLDLYAEIVRKIASRHHSPLCDLRKELRAYDLSHNPHDMRQGVLTTDGVHLTKLGNQLVAELLVAPVTQAVEYRSP